MGVSVYFGRGTGKTMLARAVAGEAGVPFFFASGSEFDDTFVLFPFFSLLLFSLLTLTGSFFSWDREQICWSRRSTGSRAVRHGKRESTFHHLYRRVGFDRWKSK